MCSGFRSFVVSAVACLVGFAPGVAFAQAPQTQQIRIESYYPHQLPAGQATTVNVAVPSRDPVKSVDVSPLAGVKVTGMEPGQTGQGALNWWQVDVEVARDAAPGERRLTLTLATGAALPITVAIADHTPAISDLRVVSARSTQPLEVQLTADAAAGLGQAPYVWFMMHCGGEPLGGVVTGTVSGGTVRAALPNPRTQVGNRPPDKAGMCNIDVRVTDTRGVESNSLRAVFDVSN